VAGAEELAIAAIVGERERVRIEDAEEARRAAAMLHVRPAGLADRPQVEAVACRDERGLVRTERVSVRLAADRPRAAVGRLLRAEDRGGAEELEVLSCHAGNLEPCEMRFNPSRLTISVAFCAIIRGHGSPG